MWFYSANNYENACLFGMFQNEHVSVSRHSQCRNDIFCSYYLRMKQHHSLIENLLYESRIITELFKLTRDPGPAMLYHLKETSKFSI